MTTDQITDTDVGRALSAATDHAMGIITTLGALIHEDDPAAETKFRSLLRAAIGTGLIVAIDALGEPTTDTDMEIVV